MSLRRLGADRRGASVVEFALLLPVMLLLMMGLAEVVFQLYVQSVLTGAVQKAGRDAGIQGGATQTSAIDAVVQSQVKSLVGSSATFTSSRTNFDSYSAIAGEPFTDSQYPTNSGRYDGICNHGEPYTDVNNNQQYDLDLSSSGQGGANDITKYSMSVTYRRLFPMAGLFKWTSTVTLSAMTILKNQPYATQSVNTGTTTRYCS